MDTSSTTTESKVLRPTISNYNIIKKYCNIDNTSKWNESDELFDQVCKLWTSLEKMPINIYEDFLNTSDDLEKIIGKPIETIEGNLADYIFKSIMYSNVIDTDIVVLKQPLTDNRFMIECTNPINTSGYAEMKGKYTTLMENPNISESGSILKYILYGSNKASKVDKNKSTNYIDPRTYILRIKERLAYKGNVMNIKNVGLDFPFLTKGDIFTRYIHFCKVVLMSVPELCLSWRNKEIDTSMFEINKESHVIKTWINKYKKNHSSYNRNFLKLYSKNPDIDIYSLVFSMMIDILNVFALPNLI